MHSILMLTIGGEAMERDAILSALAQELRRGTVVLSVLATLRQPKYGYSLVSELGEKGLPVEANTLYPLLRRLEAQGLLQSSWELGGAKPRKYYAVTPLGEEIYQALKRQWRRMAEGMDRLWEEEKG